MTFDNFMDAWAELVPDKLKELLIDIKKALNDEKASS